LQTSKRASIPQKYSLDAYLPVKLLNQYGHYGSFTEANNKVQTVLGRFVMRYMIGQTVKEPVKWSKATGCKEQARLKWPDSVPEI
jgi:hypothetical protein